jgi:hypothetical protein
MLRVFLCLLFLYSIFSCGGGSGSETSPPPEVIPPPVVTTPVYGLFDMVLPSNETRTIFLDEERSYIFSVAENNYPVSELMCVSEETLQEFSETLTAQTLNFTCRGSSNQPISLTIGVTENFSVKYIHDIEFNYELPLDDIVKRTTPNFSKLSSSSYTAPIRDDINISRFISTTSSMNYVYIYSRDWPVGGNCMAGKVFRLTESSSIITNDTNEYVSIPYLSTTFNTPTSGCSQRVLPIPSSGENLDTHIYTLEDGSFFMVFEQQYFITMARLFLDE